MIKALEDNVFYETYPTKSSICEALVGGVGEIAYKMTREYIDEIIEVKESFIEKAVEHIIKKEKIVAEPSSAICVAAVMHEQEGIKGKNAALIISWGNIDQNLMVELLNKY